jgi:NAD-dependent dihydropyrimidine dehydrogenase PreA subunit
MAAFDENWPVVIIDPSLCNGYGKRLQDCPARALQMKSGLAVVSAGLDCSHCGNCELVCPIGAISRLFLIIAL